MSGGNRGYVATALFGLAACSFGLGSFLTLEGTYQPNRYPSYQEGADQPASPTTAAISQSVQRPKEKEPCDEQRGRDESELCASWRSADAGEQAATWAWWQLILSLAGVMGLGATLWFNLEAWRQARASETDTDKALAVAERNADAASELVIVSRDNARKQLRAYVDFEAVEFVEWPLVEGGYAGYRGFLISVKNYGATPFLSGRRVFRYLWQTPNEPPRPITEYRDDMAGIAPSDFAHVNDQIALNQSQWRLVRAGVASILLSLVIEYQDAFGDTHHVSADFQTRGEEPIGLISGTKRVT